MSVTGGATPAYLITDIAALIDSKSIELVVRKSGGDTQSSGAAKGVAPAARYFFNIKNQRGPVTILVGNPTRMHDEEYASPFLLRKPEEYKDQTKATPERRPEGMYPSYGAFTALPDAEEAAAWTKFYKFFVDSILEKNLITIPARNLTGMNEEGKRKMYMTRIGELVKLPEDADEGVETKRRNVCITQKLNMDPRPTSALGTKFYVVEVVTRSDGQPALKRKLITQDTAEGMMAAGTRICSRVEIGELKPIQEKFRAMMYTREVYLLPSTGRGASNTEIIAGMAVIDDEDEGGSGDGAGNTNAGAGFGSGAGAGSASASGFGCSSGYVDADVDTGAASASDLAADMARLNEYQAALLRETDGGDGGDDGDDSDDDADEGGGDEISREAAGAGAGAARDAKRRRV